MAVLLEKPPLPGPASAQMPTILAFVFLCVFLGGAFQVLFGVLRLGGLVKYTPYPVVAGFVNGIGILLVLKQIRPVLGVDRAVPLLEIARGPGIIQPLTVAVGLSTFAGYYISRRLTKRIPASLVGLTVGTALYHGLGWFTGTASLGPVIGKVAFEWPRPTMLLGFARVAGDSAILSYLPHILFTGLILGLVGSMESLLTSMVSDNLTNTRHNSNRELMGQGIGNMVSSLFGGLPSAGSVPRTMACFRSGGRTPLSGALCSLLLLITVMVLGPVVGLLPLASIAGIVAAVGVGMFDPWTKRLLRKLTTRAGYRPRVLTNLTVTVFVTVMTVCVNLTVAVGLGVAAASVLFITRMGRSIIRRQYSGSIVHSKKTRSLEHTDLLEREGRRIVVFELQGPMFFGSAENLAANIEAAMKEATYCLVDMRRVNEIDSTGANVLRQVHARIEKDNKHLLLSYVPEGSRLWEALADMDVVAVVREGRFFPDTDAALEWAEDHLLAKLLNVVDASAAIDLDGLSITRGFATDELDALDRKLTRHTYKEGEQVLREGDTGRDLLILTRGAVSIKMRLPESGRFRRLVTFSPGVVFGEMSFLDGSPRSADAWADKDSQVLRLSLPDFQSLRAENPETAMKLVLNIAQELSHRLRATSNEVRVLEEG